MFTGIVEEVGEVASIEDLGDAVRLAVRADTVTADAEHGDSIAVNGCCLTVADNHGVVFTADVMKESLDKTSLGSLIEGSAPTPGSAVTSCKVTSTASASCANASEAPTGTCCASVFPQTWLATLPA